MPTFLAPLPARTVLSVSGDDRASFLQGLVSNDVLALPRARVVWSAFLTAQGKYLADFFMIDDPANARILLDCDAAQSALLAPKLSRYRLRAKVAIEATDLAVHSAWGDTMPEGTIVVPDPRLPSAGWRVIGPVTGVNATPDAYEAHRIALGLPDGAQDCEPDKTLLLEADFDLLNGISWTKGCYMGQELTARTRYRGLVRRRLVPVIGDQPLPPAGTIVSNGTKDVGTLRSVAGHRGLAMLRTEAFNEPLHAATTPLRAAPPAWLSAALTQADES
ncbi:folate-binding protein YgfZ [Ameyamaea chiangmaiensis]|uniref:Folate-binding protein YgfZ n=1 Tax=Ameyamaea chiangmaiensis TaxID=442969 RepID=A0A850PC90_9PROT|nr:folate-binding protein YgfZ [Ameyamaea chiangmaiensis]MBS4074256.1 folate-binding protein YgfZ [Ameyamaea chiangmaiensis]NVN41568.1 folate-binding protein YgfZ [Ameyamaea chiangmaiensis]